MDRRDKIILIVVLSVVGLGVAYFLLDRMLLSDLAMQNARRTKLTRRMNELKGGKALLSSSQKKIDAVAARTLGGDEQVVGKQVQARLSELLKKAGLAEDSVFPIKPAPLGTAAGKTGDVEVGCRVTASGKLEQISNFLYYLDSEPYAHRVGRLRLTPRKGQVNMEVEFLTLVLAGTKRRGVTTVPASMPGGVLESRPPEYAAITGRDLFRPYIQRPPVEVATPKEPDRPAEPGPTRPPDAPANPDGRQQVCDLSTYGGVCEVGVRDMNSNQVKRYKVGDALCGGTVAMIDYRVMPFPDNPKFESQARVIVKIGNEYFAVERGRTLADKWAMPVAKLPGALRAAAAKGAEKPASMPATAAAMK